jgi:hypothetical protein
MPVIVATKTRYSGTITPSELNVETTVVEVTAQSDDYIIEGWLDLGNLAVGDSAIVKEYVAIDGINYRLFVQTRVDGTVPEPAVRFHAKLFGYNMKYKVTVTQVAGTPRSYPYTFILEVLGTT